MQTRVACGTSGRCQGAAEWRVWHAPAPAAIWSSAEDFREADLHRHHRGTSGNALHLAAARGHAPLVSALLAVGLKPNAVNDAHYAIKRGRGGGKRRVASPPISWARVRDHTEVIRVLEMRRREHGPPLLRLPATSSPSSTSAVRIGTLKKFVMREAGSFGFICPDQRGGGEVFVHLETLRGAARKNGKLGYPAPGMRLVYIHDVRRAWAKAKTSP